MLRNWKLKAVVQKALSKMPFGNQVNYLLQRHVTKGIQLTEGYFEDRLGHALMHWQAWRRLKPGMRAEVSLEIGTGWHPIVPIMMFLGGCEQVHTADVKRCMTAKSLRETIAALLRHFESAAREWQEIVHPGRLDYLRGIYAQMETRSVDEVLRDLNIHYVIGDAAELLVAADTVDIWHSNNTFEHIPEAKLQEIVHSGLTSLKPGGLFSHFIDMSDHFAHFDPSISIYNFLRYSRRRWARIDNSIQPQNRLRLADYEAMFGPSLQLLERSGVRPGLPEVVKALDLDQAYADRDPEELAISHAYLVGLK